LNTDHYFVQIQHRPRRLAFLVDVDQCSDALFNQIVDFNITCWGGRHNPVIPVLDGKITDSYWRLLNLVDPDILYSYCDLPAPLVARISSDIRPLNVLKHHSMLPGDHQFRVRLDEQASVLPALKRAGVDLPVFARKPEPAVLLFEDKDVKELSSFALRNFGGNSQLNIWCRDSQVPSHTVPANDKETMKALGVIRNLILPIDICADAPRKLKAEAEGDGWSIALTIWYGNSPWNFVEYWNSAHFRGVPAGGLKALWMPKGFLDDAELYQSLIAMMRSRVFVSEQSSRLRLISYDEDKAHLSEITKQIAKDFKWNMHMSDPVVRSKGELPDFKPMAAVTGLFPSRTVSRRHAQVSGKSAFVEIIPPVDLPDRNERWMAEFAVEDPQQERFYANRTAWWKLPQKNRVANLLIPHSPCRVGNDYAICAEVSGNQQGVLLNIPDPSALFSMLLIPSAPPDWVRLFNPEVRHDIGNTLYVRASDKGRYARGVLGLFESLQKAGYVFEHRFWGDVIESLATPVASPHTKNKVLSDLKRMGLDSLTLSDRFDQLADEVLDAAGRIQRPNPYVTFARLCELYWSYLQTLQPSEQLNEIGAERDLTEEKQIREAARRHLRNLLSELTARKLFLHGAEVQCRHCLAALWYHVDDLQSGITCRGCRKDIHLPAETQWSYALNELVATAVRDHGVAPVIRTALRLFAESRECFYFLPGMEIRDYKTEPEKQVCELDLVWIRDGVFGIAEVKRTPRKFDVSKNLVMILGAALPDKFLLASPAGKTEEMQKFQIQVRSQIDHNISVDTWGEEIFARSADLGWDTFRHALFG
jgi:hypothetical protein